MMKIIYWGMRNLKTKVGISVISKGCYTKACCS